MNRKHYPNLFRLVSYEENRLEWKRNKDGKLVPPKAIKKD